MIRALRLLAGAALLGGVSLLAIPERAISYSLIGQSLPMTQRDFRVYNNFPGSNANNNFAQISNMPGYDGAELALWKAGIEWNARPHGDGTGDPLQPVLGNGDANFSFFWNGNASGIGTTNDNIISSIGGSSGGVLAYTEMPLNNGWRIRYYGSAWDWHDGPSSVSGLDIQGVGCHELGHALGLAHTNNFGATMYPSVSGSGTSERSIESDDRNGVRAIYGARSDTLMPRIDSIAGSFTPGGSITITGENFSSTGNTLWLNNSVLDSGFGGGEARKLFNLSSTAGGTLLSATLPASGWEQKGAVHVQRSGTAGYTLSESHPAFATGPVVDSVQLQISNVVPQPGNFVTVTVTDGMHPLSPYMVYWSLTNTGTSFNGQPFDIGPPNGDIGTGSLNLGGTKSFTRRVPANAHLWTVYLEARVDQLGVTYDSNMLTVYVQ